MIGAAKTQLATGAVITSNYRVNLSPGSLDVFSFNGSSTSPTCFSTVLDGTGPFTYLWIINNGSINILSPSSSNTKFQASGFNTTISGVATLTVTDTGNGNAETSRNITVEFEFEQ